MTNQSKRWEFVPGSEINVNGHILRRIRALVDMIGHCIGVGDLGGFAEREENLPQDSLAWIAVNAKVYGKAQIYDKASVSGNAQIYGDARVCGGARVFGDARVYGSAKVQGRVTVYDNAQVFGHALVYGDAQVYHYAQVFDNAQIYGDAMVFGNARVFGHAHVFNCARAFGNVDIYADAGKREDVWTWRRYALLPGEYATDTEAVMKSVKPSA